MKNAVFYLKYSVFLENTDLSKRLHYVKSGENVARAFSPPHVRSATLRQIPTRRHPSCCQQQKISSTAMIRIQMQLLLSKRLQRQLLFIHILPSPGDTGVLLNGRDHRQSAVPWTDRPYLLPLYERDTDLPHVFVWRDTCYLMRCRSDFFLPEEEVVRDAPIL